MAKTLELTFGHENGKTTKITLDGPIEPVDTQKVLVAMQSIINANIFMTANGAFASSEGIRLIERNVTEYEVQ